MLAHQVVAPLPMRSAQTSLLRLTNVLKPSGAHGPPGFLMTNGRPCRRWNHTCSAATGLCQASQIPRLVLAVSSPCDAPQGLLKR